jgi:hypothetical protein
VAVTKRDRCEKHIDDFIVEKSTVSSTIPSTNTRHAEQPPTGGFFHCCKNQVIVLDKPNFDELKPQG